MPFLISPEVDPYFYYLLILDLYQLFKLLINIYNNSQNSTFITHCHIKRSVIRNHVLSFMCYAIGLHLIIIEEYQVIQASRIQLIPIQRQQQLQQIQMRDAHENDEFATGNLEQKLISTRYSVIDKMINIKDSLQKQKNTIRKQKTKINELQRKINQLELGESYNNRVAQKYLDKLQKLQNTQSMSIALISIKTNNQKQKDQHLFQRQKACGELRESIMQSRRKSLQFFQKRKTARVQKIRKQHFEYYLQKKKLSESDLQNRRNKSNQIRQSQILCRQRLKRYQIFKLAQARFHYDEKKEQLIRSHAEKLNELRNLKSRVPDVEQVFRKTQILNQQVDQIQSLYITGQ